MKILVTGANGYLGQGIVKAILDNENEVIASDFRTDYIDDRAKKMACNLFEIDNQYDFIDYPEFCTQVVAVIEQSKEQGIINICSGRPYDSKAIWGDGSKIEKIMKR